MFTDTERRFQTIPLSASVDISIRNGGGIVDVTAKTKRWLHQAVRMLIRYTGDKPIDELTSLEIDAWHLSNLQRVKATTANGYLRAIKTLYARLIDRGLVAIDPAKPVPYATEAPSQPAAISRETYEAMRSATDARGRAIVDMLWSTGCRLGGLLSMKVSALEIWRDSSGQACLATVVKEKSSARQSTRGGRTRHVYAKGRTVESVEAYLEERISVEGCDHFITSRYGLPLSENGLQSAMRKIRKDARIPASVPSNIHAFRHAFAIRMLDEGKDLALVSDWLGHKDPAFTMKVYAVRSESELRRAYFAHD